MHLPPLAAALFSLALHLVTPLGPSPRAHVEPAGTSPDTLAADLDLVRRAQAARVLGAAPDSAAVIIFEFFDYACSTCQDFHRVRGDSLRALAGPDVTLSLHHYIIPRLVRGYPAAEAAACAAGLGGREAFLAYHDRLLREPGAWRDVARRTDRFRAWAVEVGLPEAAFSDCLARDVPSMLIMADGQLAASFGVRGTPTFVIQPRGAESLDEAVIFYGNESMARFREAIAEVRGRAR